MFPAHGCRWLARWLLFMRFLAFLLNGEDIAGLLSSALQNPLLA